MQRKALFTIFLLTIFGLMLALPVIAQDDAIASGLLNPRQMSFDADGNLYIAEAGVGGTGMTADETPIGATSRVSMVSPEGEISIAINGLPSYRDANSLGVADIYVGEDSYWIILGENADFSVPFNNALVEISKENGRVLNFVDLLTTELELDPDGNPNGQSNPVDMEVTEDGTVLIANAGCNCIMSWSAEDGVQVAASWSHADDNPVPTAIDVGPDGDLYVGFLTGFPFPAESSRVERWSEGELVETFEGMTAVTGLLVTEDGTIYAVEHGIFEMNTGWGPGRVVTVSADGIEPVLEDLTSPYGIAQAPDGTIVVSIGSTSGADGAVVAVPMMQ